MAERSLASRPPRALAGRAPGATPLLVPTTLREANAFVARFHRHSGAVRGHKFSVGAALGDELVGVAIAGRPVARHRDDGLTIEVLRVCVAKGAPRNVCSLLYGACWRAARAMGYRRAITYTLRTETGASVKASGFRVIGEVRRQSWDRPSRPRAERESRERLCWERAT
ncbi:MAG TPA: XF1762 family protein [Solirubrobacterales bacterium]|nr:XF1762 family protein [Solirubrobacterales bacterium]